MTKRRKIVFFILIVLTVLGVALIVISASGTKLDGIAGFLGSPVRRLQKAVTGIGDDIGKNTSVKRDYKGVLEEIERLTAENERLKQLEREYGALSEENEELRRLLGMEERAEGYDIRRASVITKDLTDWYNEFTIDLGSADGVVNGTVVVTSYGLVGLVCGTGKHDSKVRCIIDERSSLMCRIERNSELLRVTGTSNENFTAGIVADRIAKNAAVYVGDRIVTADSGGVYPPGIVVGTVVSVGVDAEGNRYAELSSDVRFTALTSVTVLIPKAPAESEQ